MFPPLLQRLAERLHRVWRLRSCFPGPLHFGADRDAARQGPVRGARLHGGETTPWLLRDLPAVQAVYRRR